MKIIMFKNNSQGRKPEPQPLLDNPQDMVFGLGIQVMKIQNGPKVKPQKPKVAVPIPKMVSPAVS
jgi:hypothetical protein